MSKTNLVNLTPYNDADGRTPSRHSSRRSSATVLISGGLFMKSRISLPIRMTIGMVLGVAAGLAAPSMGFDPV